MNWLRPSDHHFGTLGGGRVDSFSCTLSPEALAFSCFTELMKRMNQNFPHGGAMDTHFANMRKRQKSLVCCNPWGHKESDMT